MPQIILRKPLSHLSNESTVIIDGYFDTGSEALFKSNDRYQFWVWSLLWRTWQILCCYRVVGWPLIRLRPVCSNPVDSGLGLTRKPYFWKNVIMEIVIHPCLGCLSHMRYFRLLRGGVRSSVVYAVYLSRISQISIAPWKTATLTKPREKITRRHGHSLSLSLIADDSQNHHQLLGIWSVCTLESQSSLCKNICCSTSLFLSTPDQSFSDVRKKFYSNLLDQTFFSCLVFLFSFVSFFSCFLVSFVSYSLLSFLSCSLVSFSLDSCHVFLVFLSRFLLLSRISFVHLSRFSLVSWFPFLFFCLVFALFTCPVFLFFECLVFLLSLVSFFSCSLV